MVLVVVGRFGIKREKQRQINELVAGGRRAPLKPEQIKKRGKSFKPTEAQRHLVATLAGLRSLRRLRLLVLHDGACARFSW